MNFFENLIYFDNKLGFKLFYFPDKLCPDPVFPYSRLLDYIVLFLEDRGRIYICKT